MFVRTLKLMMIRMLVGSHSPKVLAALLKGIDIGTQSGCMVVDLIPYDASLGSATMSLRREVGGLPNMGCMSMIWVGTESDRLAVNEFIDRTTRCNLSMQMKKGESGVQGAAELGPERDAASFGTERPVLDEKKFKYTRPMSDGTLRLHQILYTKWADDDRFKEQFDKLAAGHNEHFNLSGVPYKAANKRTADKYSLRDHSDAVNLSGVPGAPVDKNQVVARHETIVILMGISSSFEVMISGDGSFYLHGLEDSVVPADLALFGGGDGVYDLGQNAVKTMNSGVTLKSRALADRAVLGMSADPMVCASGITKQAPSVEPGVPVV